MKELTYEAARCYAIATIEQACIDYNNVLMNKTSQLTSTTTRKELETFFKSKWFGILSEGNLDGPKIMRQIQENAKNKINTHVDHFYNL